MAFFRQLVCLVKLFLEVIFAKMRLNYCS